MFMKPRSWERIKKILETLEETTEGRFWLYLWSFLFVLTFTFAGLGLLRNAGLLFIKRQETVVLFFPNDKMTGFYTEKRKIPAVSNQQKKLKEVMDELLKGPRRPDLVSPFPSGTRCLEVFISKAGTAYLNFSSELKTGHPGGSTAEWATIMSIVKTVARNVNVKRVKILISDCEVETLAGHVNLIKPLEVKR